MKTIVNSQAVAKELVSLQNVKFERIENNTNTCNMGVFGSVYRQNISRAEPKNPTKSEIKFGPEPKN